MVTKDKRAESIWPTLPDPLTDHVYAIGKLSNNYNNLEGLLLCVIQHYCSLSNEITAFLFEKLPNHVRIEWLEKTIALDETDSAVISSIKHFLSAFNICTKNRNLLVHSNIMAYRLTDNALITSKRNRNTGEEKLNEFSLDAIRRVADEIDFWDRYGRHVSSYLNRRSFGEKKLPEGMQLIEPTTLPGTPPLPVDLTANSPRK
jgi:hypothetical protein